VLLNGLVERACPMAVNGDEGSAEDTLNFYCRLPSERAKGMERKSTPPPMVWLRRILDTYEQPVNEAGKNGTGTKRQTNGGESSRTRHRQQTASSSVSADSLRAGPSSRSSDVDGNVYDEPEDDEADEEEEEAPWFSQLAALPQVRSAGVPMVAPSQTIPIGKRVKDVSSSSTRRPQSSRSTVTLSRAGGVNEEPNSDAFSGADGSANAATSSSATSSLETPIGTSYSTIESTSINSSRSSLLPASGTASVNCGSNFTSPSIELKTDLPLDPPDNFAMVNSWVYRSSFPKKRHFPFLQSLKLRSVLTLILEEYPEQNMKFLDDNGITFFQFGIPGNKEPFVQIPHEKITAALVTIMDRRNHPMLIHCNKGKHRTGCLIGCLRKLQQWSLSTVFDEYRRFSFPKSRSMDQEFIELYREHVVWSKVQPSMLPRWAVLGKRVENHLVEGDDDEARSMTLLSSAQTLSSLSLRQPPRLTGM
jgi:tyrosine-protein phosphatase SIW14